MDVQDDMCVALPISFVWLEVLLMLTVIFCSDDIIYEPFSYRHLGSLAYIGNSAVFDFNGYSLAGELVVTSKYY